MIRPSTADLPRKGPPSTKIAASRRVALVEYVAVALILLLAAYLRLAKLNFAQFSLDDSTLWTIAWKALRDRTLLMQGMEASLGMPNGPFQAYVVMLPMIFTTVPLASHIVVAVLNVAGVFFCWLFCRRYFGSRIALVATLLLAVNPWAVIYSRRLWGNDMTAPITALLAWALCDLVAKGRRRDSFLPFLWLAALVQMYVVALVHVATFAAGILLGWRRVRVGPLLAGLAVTFVLVSPYALGAALPNIGAAMHHLNEDPTRPTVIDLVSTRFALHIVGSEGYQAFSNQTGRVLDLSQGVPKALGWLAAGLLLLGSFVAIARCVASLRAGNRTSATPYVLGLIAIYLPPLLLVRHAAPVYAYYVLVGFPMQFIFMAVGVDWLLRPRAWLDSRPVVLWASRVGVAGVLLATVGIQLVAAQVFFSVIDEFWYDNDYGLPLQHTMNVTKITEDMLSQNDIQRAYLLGGREYQVVLGRVLRHDGFDPIGYDSANMLVAPRADAGKLLFVVTDRNNFGTTPIVENFAQNEVASYVVPGQGLTFEWFTVDASRVPDVLPRSTSQAGYTFASEVHLDGYSLSAKGDETITRTLTLNWTLLRDYDPQLAQLYYYVRLIDDAGTVYDRVDRWFYGNTNWRAGDRVSTTVDYAVKGRSPGRYWLLTGMYSLASRDQYVNVPVVDDTGKSMGEWVRLGPVYVRPTDAPEPSHRLGADFGGKATLDGFDLKLEQTGDQKQLLATLYWRGKAKMDRNYTVFVHLLDAQGRLVAQHDGQPQEGRYPTGGWVAGDVIVDLHRLTLPSTFESGRYTLEAGLYDRETGVRVGANDFAARWDVSLP